MRFLGCLFLIFPFSLLLPCFISNRFYIFSLLKISVVGVRILSTNWQKIFTRSHICSFLASHSKGRYNRDMSNSRSGSGGGGPMKSSRPDDRMHHHRQNDPRMNHSSSSNSNNTMMNKRNNVSFSFKPSDAWVTGVPSQGSHFKRSYS